MPKGIKDCATCEEASRRLSAVMCLVFATGIHRVSQTQKTKRQEPSSSRSRLLALGSGVASTRSLPRRLAAALFVFTVHQKQLALSIKPLQGTETSSDRHCRLCGQTKSATHKEPSFRVG